MIRARENEAITSINWEECLCINPFSPIFNPLAPPHIEYARYTIIYHNGEYSILGGGGGVTIRERIRPGLRASDSGHCNPHVNCAR